MAHRGHIGYKCGGRCGDILLDKESIRVKGSVLTSDRTIVIGSILFAIVNAYLISLGMFLQLAIPFGLLAAVLVLLETKNLLLFIALVTPFSMNLEQLEQFGGIGFYFPTEPLLLGMTLVFAVWAMGRNRYDGRILAQPFSVVVIAGLAWIFITCLTSSLPLISFKFFLSRLWFVIPLYFLAVYFFEEKKVMDRYFLFYILGLAVVIVLTTFEHAVEGFSQESSNLVPRPFYKDHTSYGAVIAMFLPLVIGRTFSSVMTSMQRVGWSILLLVFTTGMIFSYTRAAWLSLILALGVFIVMKLRIRFWTVFGMAATLTVALFYFQDDITRELERNDQDSSDSLAEHIQSMTNISSDASNLERLNRWNSAWKMFEERPLVGWGPGTYMFLYAPYQKSSELTIISTNRGTGGNAHSEYLGPLSEQGVFGMVSFILILIFIVHKGVTLYYKLEDKEMRMLVMSMTLGLITYFAHGILNNFLDTDKVSVPFWGFCAGIIAIDIYHRNRAESSAISS